MTSSLLTTDALVDRATRAVSDPDLTPYSEPMTAALAATVAQLAETRKRLGPPVGFDVLRDLCLAILVDFDAAEAKSKQAAKFHRELADLRAQRDAARVGA